MNRTVILTDDGAAARVLRHASLAAYSALSFALAMAMLPIYMIAPKFYGDTLGVSLGLLGAVLFGVRLVDTFQDPLIGRLVDWLARMRHGWNGLLVVAAALLALGFVLLFHVPPNLSSSALLWWMAGCLVLVYTAHSLMNVCYLSWGARLTDDTEGRARVSGWREASGVLGVVAASVLPAVWVAQVGAERAYGWFAWVFVAILGLMLLITLGGSPRPILPTVRSEGSWRTAFSRTTVGQELWLWRLYGFYLLNATAAAIPATLILFYVDDVLQESARAGMFLGAYFLAGLFTLGFWVRLSDRVGKARAWALGSAVSAAGLMIAALLGTGDVWLYLLVCVLTGSALGADLALPAAMLADAISPQQRSNTGLYFGVWALIAKFALALSAGASLPLLSLLGYLPGQPESAASLAYVYALLPVLFKTLAAWVIRDAIFTRQLPVKEK